MIIIDDTDDGSAEVECVDCGCDIIVYPEDCGDARCDTCRDHHDQDCGEDCPIICENCKEHHFKPDGDKCPYPFDDNRFLTSPIHSRLPT